MAEEKRTAPGGKPRRRHAPQIDLTATEVTTETAHEPQAAEAAAEPQAGASAPEPPKPSAPPLPQPSPVMTYAAVASAVIAAVIVGGALLWIASTPPNSGDAELTTRLAALEAQIRDLAQRPAPQIQIDTRALDALTQRISKVEDIAGRPAPAAAPDSALNARIGALETGLTALNRRAEALQSGLQQAPGAGVIEVLSKRIDALEHSATATQDRSVQNAGADTAARRTLAILMLRDAVSRGAPFAAELTAVKALGADTQAVAALEPFATSGIPNDAALSRELTLLLPSMITASNANPMRSGGFLERLEANASRLVRIRPVGEPGGDDPAAVLARIEVKLSRGDIGGADKEITALPEKARALAEPWRKKVAARTAALEASRKLATDGAAALAR